MYLDDTHALLVLSILLGNIIKYLRYITTNKSFIHKKSSTNFKSFIINLVFL